MGVFHCPVGSAYYEDEPCIDCGLCLATTEEEMGRASKRIRDYLRSQAEARKGPGRKIAVCGKGGTGKSTIVALMANAFLELGYCVLVLDTDESNTGLPRMLGFGRQSRPIMVLRQRFPSGETKPRADWLNQKEISFQEIPGEYLLARDNLIFLSTGKIVEPFQGCACSMAELAGDLVRKLVLKDKEIVLMDTEAGIESFGRGVESGADTVLIAVEPSSESLALAEKIFYMADGLGINRIRAILNKVPSEKVERRVLEEVERKKMKVIGSLYLDSQISDASLEGKAPPGDSFAQKAMKEIAGRLLNES